MTQKTSILTATILTLCASTIVGLFLSSQHALAKNDTFTNFSLSIDDYPASTNDEAKEIAYYAHYVLPLISTQDGCLGSRVNYTTDSSESTQSYKAYHINRCSELHASDYARLNYIFSLNYRLNQPDANHLRYLHRLSDSDGSATSPSTDTNNPTNKQPQKVSLADKTPSDDDQSYLNNLKRLANGKFIGEVILPSAVDDTITESTLTKLFIPNVDLADGKTAWIFGFNGVDKDQPYDGWKNMHYGSINYALKDCGKWPSAAVDESTSIESNNRAILLNPKVPAIEELRESVSERKDTCKESSKVGSKNLIRHLQDHQDDILKELKLNLIMRYANLRSLVPEAELDILNSLEGDALNRIIEHLITNSDTNKRSLLKTWSKDEKDKECFFYINSTSSLSIYGANSCGDHNIFADELIKTISKEADNYIKRETNGQTNNPTLAAFITARENEISECDKHYAQTIVTPTCDVLTSILKQVDHPADSQYFLNNRTLVNSAENHPRWLPLTDTEKEVMQFDNEHLLDGNKGGNQIHLLATEPQSSCYFTGVKSLLCTSTNFLSTLTNSAFNIIESLVSFPGQLMKSNSGAGEVNLYSAWKIFRDMANIVLIIILLLSIMSQVTGWKIAALGIKNNISRIIMAAIMLNLSFVICQLAIDLSNLVGSSIRGFIGNGQSTLMQAMNLPSGQMTVFDSTTAKVLMFTAGLTTLVYIVTHLVILLPVIIGALISATVTVFTLMARHLFIVILVLTSPIMLTLLGNNITSKYAAKWWKALFSTLIVYPVIALAFSVGEFSYRIVTAVNGDNLILEIAAIALLFLPLTLVPSIIKKSIASLPLIGDKISKLSNQIPNRAKNSLANSTLVRAAQANEARQKRLDKLGRTRPNAIAHPLRALRSWANRPKHGNNRLSQGASRLYNSIYEKAYSDRLLFGEADSDWMKEQYGNMYKYGNGDASMARLRDFLTDNTANITANEAVADLLTVADDGAGYFEEILMVTNRLVESGVDQNNMSEVMEKVIDGYAKNSRFEIVAMLKQVRDDTAGNYNMRLENFNTTYSAPQQQQLVEKELLGLTKDPRGIFFPKFGGVDDRSKVSSVEQDTYNSRLAINSTQTGLNAFSNLYRNDPHFRRYITANYPRMNQKGQRFVRNLR